MLFVVRRLLPVVLLLGLVADVPGQPLPFEFVAEVTVGAMPESVIGDGQFLYASNLGPGANFLAKDGNGYISQLSYDGDLLEQSFITLAGQLDGPTGMAFVGERLFAADLDEVIGFDLSGVAPPVRIDLSSTGETFTNDLVAVSDHHLLASGTNTKQLFLIDTTSQSYETLGLDFTLDHPNGLAFDSSSDKLYVAANTVHAIGGSQSNGKVLVLDLDVGSAAATLDDTVSNAGYFLDGIALFGDHEAIVSDWVSGSGATGVLRRFDTTTGSLGTPTNLQLRGFADFHWQANREILAAPNLLDGKVRLLSLPVPEPSGVCLLLVATGGVAACRWRRVPRLICPPR